MKDKIHVFVHCEDAANFICDSLSEEKLLQLQLFCFSENFCFDVTISHGVVCLSCYPYSIKVKDSFRHAFKDAIFAIYHTNFL